MSKVFKLNLAGLNEIMKSDAMQDHLSEAAGQVQTVAGKGYESRVVVASYAAIGQVYPTDYESAQDNLNNNTLEKALGGLPRSKG